MKQQIYELFFENLLYIIMLLNISQENLEAVDAEDAAVADTAALAGGKQLHVAPAAVERVAK